MCTKCTASSTVHYATCVDCGSFHAIGAACDSVVIIPITGTIAVKPFNVNAGADFSTPVLFAPTPSSVVIAEQAATMLCLACARPLAANGACFTCNPIRKHTC